jgi:hypothetical protein
MEANSNGRGSILIRLKPAAARLGVSVRTLYRDVAIWHRLSVLGSGRRRFGTPVCAELSLGQCSLGEEERQTVSPLRPNLLHIGIGEFTLALAAMSGSTSRRLSPYMFGLK